MRLPLHRAAGSRTRPLMSSRVTNIPKCVIGSRTFCSGVVISLYSLKTNDVDGNFKTQVNTLLLIKFQTQVNTPWQIMNYFKTYFIGIKSL